MSDQKSPRPSLSIVIPVYNEEENIEPLLKEIFGSLSSDPDFLELLLVDDGSLDRTAELIRDAASREPRIHLLQHRLNRGLGASIRTGLQSARGELVLYTDADVPFDFSLIPRLVALAGDNNVVIGRRANRGEGPRRLILTKGYNLICRAVFGLRTRDVNFACKVIPRRALAGMRLVSEGSFIHAEILLECKRQGFTLTEFPLTYFPRTRGQSTLSRVGVIFGILREMGRYILRSKNGKKYDLVEEIDHKRG